MIDPTKIETRFGPRDPHVVIGWAVILGTVMGFIVGFIAGILS